MAEHETYETRTEITIVVPASGATDLADPFTGRIVIPTAWSWASTTS